MRFFITIAMVSLTSLVFSQNDCPQSDSVSVIKQWDALFKYNNYFISGQPEEEEMVWFKDQGVTKMINLRTESENKDLVNDGFNEKRSAKKLGLEYYSLPIDGSSDYTPENLAKLMEYIDPGEKVVIHCRSGGRANNFFMAYLIREEGYDINRAVRIGKQIKFSLPFESILGSEIEMKIIE